MFCGFRGLLGSAVIAVGFPAFADDTNDPLVDALKQYANIQGMFFACLADPGEDRTDALVDLLARKRAPGFWASWNGDLDDARRELDLDAKIAWLQGSKGKCEIIVMTEAGYKQILAMTGDLIERSVAE